MAQKLFSLLLSIFVALFLSACMLNQSQTHSRQYLDKGWQLFSSENVTADGMEISSARFDDSFGYPIEVPSTVLNGLRQNGLLPDVFAPYVLEQMDKTPFQVPWWYRKVFQIDERGDLDFYQLTFDGINFKANIWLNGVQIANQDSVQGSYGVWSFDISNAVRKGKNILAVEIIPPLFGTDVSKGFVDWNPTPADRSMGIWREVYLTHSGPVSMRHANVVSKVDKVSLNYAEVTISMVLTNHTSQKQEVSVSAHFDNVSLSKRIELNPNEIREVFFRPEEFTQLAIKNPRLWWPNNMGAQHLYDLKLSVSIGDRQSDEETFRFGIREIDDFWNESGFRGFMVNGQKVMVRSAGWVDDIFLADTDEKVRAQLKYAKHMNLNSIRLESFWGRNRTIMETADELGLLLMLGWTAHWEWEPYIGIPHDEYVSIRGDEAKRLHADNYRDQVLWHRRHPSVAIWTYGSDKLPRPKLEIMLNERMAQADTTRPILSYCGGTMLMGSNDPRQSEISGPTGVKMEGPYDWVAPVYWYIDTRYGGAFGFNTEVGPGPQIPPLATILKMIPREHLWPVDDVWLYYSGRNQFENLDRYLDAFHARYGESDNLESFLFKNQMASYEAIRPMFEAFSVNKFHSTGVVQWMFNSAWPTFYWQLFDYFLMPNGAFYGTRKAAAPLSPIYNYGDGNIYVNSDYLSEMKGLKLQVKVLDVHSKLLFESESTFDIPANSAIKVLDMPAIKGLTSAYFLDLRLFDADGNRVENNFYWLSTVADVPDFEKTTWYWTPNSQFADFKALNTMPDVEVDFSYIIERQGSNYLIKADLKNPSQALAFFIELQLVDQKNGEPVLPVFWDDNYVSLLPGETRVLTATIAAEGLESHYLKVEMQGMNLK